MRIREDDKGAKLMFHMFVRHKVADYTRWKQVFDSHAQAQQDAGLRVEHVWRSVEDPSEVCLLLRVEDLHKARAFVEAPSVPDARTDAGVLDHPDIYFLRTV